MARWLGMLSGPVEAAVDRQFSDGGTCRITIVGDSHAELFDCLSQRPLRLADRRIVDANVVPVKAATIRGFGKRRSTLDVRRKSLGAIRENDDAVVFAYGQVDIELGYFYRLHVKHEELAFDPFAAELAENYTARLAALPLNAVPIVKGVNLSVLSWSRQKAISFTCQILDTDDTADRRALEMELAEKFPSGEEIDRRHRLFNTHLKAAAAKHGLAYFDFLEATADRRTGHIKRRWVPRTFDHHARRKKSLYRIVRRSLAGALVEAVPKVS
ncbi:MAG: hypothetical protein AAFW98_05995 [Pseudomonadota bacterium]